jgi:hypothetical protein
MPVHIGAGLEAKAESEGRENHGGESAVRFVVLRD